MNRVMSSLQRRLSSLSARGRRILWIARNGIAKDSIPIFIVGSQRSGTGMLSACFGRSPEFEDFGESDARAFFQYSLRDDGTLKRLIEKSWSRFVVFKPLKDSHRVADLLALHHSARAIWVYRRFEDRVNSAVRQFGRHPLEVFESFKSGRLDRWQLQGMSGEVRAGLELALNREALSESDAAALMWWLRNSLYFSQRLDADSRVMLWSYDTFVAGTEQGLRELLGFVGGTWDSRMLSGVHDRSIGKEPAPVVAAPIREMCHGLYTRLESARIGQSRMREQH